VTPIPEPTITIASLIDEQHEKQINNPRSHLGCSQLGEKCERKIWLVFRWVMKSEFPGRILRLFRRGQLEEKTIIADLESIGVKIDGAQTWFNLGCHVSGSCDGIGIGVPNAPKKKFVLEIKTHSEKSWNEVCKKGVKESKPTHWGQMQSYMIGAKLDRALYFAINKNDDSIYTEWVRLEKDEAEKLIERAKRIALAERMPEGISADPSWYECKMCQFHANCFEKRLPNQVNCRNCAHSTPKPDGTWRCERFDADDIPVEFQRRGCDSHVLHPDIVPWEIDTKHSTERVAAFKVGDRIIHNGEGDANTYTSLEIITLGENVGNQLIDETRISFDAKVV